MKLRRAIHNVFESRIFYIAFSILVAITVWLYVAYIENPDESNPVSGIKVEYLKEDYVNDRGLVITERSTDTVTVRFTGKRSVVAKLSNENVTVTVDLANVKATGVYSLPYDIVYPIDVNEIGLTTSRKPEFITISVDKLAQKEVDVKGTFGSVAEGYQAEPIEITPGVITVYGPEEVVSQIDHAWVNVPRDNISKTVDEELSFTLMDAEGHEVVSDLLTFSQDKVNVRIQVDMIKELPLEVLLTPAAGADETNTTYTVSPRTITISGDAETLEGINKISLGPIDLASFTTTTTEDFPIILPNGTKNLSNVTTATVTVTISGLDTKTLNVTNIDTINLSREDYTASVLTSSQDVQLRGLKEELDEVTEKNVRIVADLSEYSTGIFSVNAKVYIGGDFSSVGAIGTYKVTVSITETPSG